MKECKTCGITYDDDVKFCGECGQTLASEQEPKTVKEQKAEQKVEVASDYDQPVAIKNDTLAKTKLDKNIVLSNIILQAMWALAACWVFLLLWRMPSYITGFPAEGWGWYFDIIIGITPCFFLIMVAVVVWNFVLRVKRWSRWKQNDQ